jgi:hypothetical protein
MFFSFPVVLLSRKIYLRKLIILEKVKNNFSSISCSLVDLSINIRNCFDTNDLAQYQKII